MRFKKLYKFWDGPWVIKKFKSPLVVEIEHVQKRTKHGRLTKQIVHVDRLTPCKLADDAEVESDVEPDTQPAADTQADTHWLTHKLTQRLIHNWIHRISVLNQAVRLVRDAYQNPCLLYTSPSPRDS